MSGSAGRIVAAALIGCALALGGTVLSERIEDPAIALAALLSAAAIVVMIIGVATRPTPRLTPLCDPLVLTFVFISQFYVVGAASYVLLGITPLPFMRPFPSLRIAQAACGFLLFVTGIAVGYRSPGGRVIERMLPDFTGSARRLSGIWAEVLIIGGSLVGCIAWLDYQGGLWAKLQEGYSAGKAGGAMFAIAHQGLVAGTFIMAWRIYSKPKPGLLERAAFIGLLVFDALFLGVLFGVRKYLFFLYFGLVAIWVLRRGWETLPKLRIASVLAGLMIFFSIWGMVRDKPLLNLVTGVENPNRLDESGASRGRFLEGLSGPFAIACMVWDLFPNVEPYRHGQTLEVALYGFIPRAVWPEKPIGIGKEITRYVVGPFYEEYYGFSVTVTLPADLYLNFSWPGLAIGALFLGIVCRAVSEYAQRGMVNGLQLVPARVLLPASMLITLAEVRSDMATMISTLVLGMFPILLALACFRLAETGREPSTVALPVGPPALRAR